MARLTVYTLALSALASASRSGLQDLASYPKYEVQFLADRPIKLSDAQRCEQFGLSTDDDWLDLRPRTKSDVQQKERERIEASSGSSAAVESTAGAVTASDVAVAGEIDHPRGKSELADANPSPKLVRMHFTHEEYDAPHGYMCALPSLNTTNAQQAAAKAEQHEPEPDPNKSWEALSYLEDRCLYAVHGWFTYAYCHNQYIRQFHSAPGGKPGPNGFEPKEDTQYDAYNLGFSRGKAHGREGAEAPVTTFGIGPWSRYLVQRWTDGTRCAETRKPREVEVQVHCSLSSGDSIFMIKEVSLCQYVLVIYTPSLCSLPGFRPQSALDVEPAGIRCREMMEDDDFEQWNTDRIERERIEHQGKLLEGVEAEEKQKAKTKAEARIKENEEAEKEGRGVKEGKGAKNAESGKESHSESASEEADKKGTRGGHTFTEDDLAGFTFGGRELDETTKKLIKDAIRGAFGVNDEDEEIEISFLNLHGDDEEEEEVAGGLGLPIIKLEDLADVAKSKAKEATKEKKKDEKKKDDQRKPTVRIPSREAGNLGVRVDKEEKTEDESEPKEKSKHGGAQGGPEAEKEKSPLRDEL